MHVDASSGFEAERALLAGVPAEQIQITSQELPQDLKGLVERGVLFNACSLEQLEAYGRLFPGHEVSVRINPGLGSGHNNRTNVGGPASSFGIWHDHLDQIETIQARADLRITRMHSHIGSGGDPETWKHCARLTLGIATRLPEVTRLNLGGGFKIARMPDETSANLAEIGSALLPDFQNFAAEHGRELHLEIEPGSYLVARAGAIVANVIDVVDTGSEGYTFAKVDSGMTEFLRPNLYGAQHPISIVPGDGYTRSSAPYRWLLEFLSEMGAADRAAFLQFVTARPRPPAGGLRALPSPIRVQQPAATSASTPYPATRTCQPSPNPRHRLAIPVNTSFPESPLAL